MLCFSLNSPLSLFILFIHQTYPLTSFSPDSPYSQDSPTALQTCSSSDHRSSYSIPVCRRSARPTPIASYSSVCARFRCRISSTSTGVISLCGRMSNSLGPRTSFWKLDACCRRDAKITMRIRRRLGSGLANGLVGVSTCVIRAPRTSLLCITLRSLASSQYRRFCTRCSSKYVRSMALYHLDRFWNLPMRFFLWPKDCQTTFNQQITSKGSIDEGFFIFLFLNFLLGNWKLFWELNCLL